MIPTTVILLLHLIAVATLIYAKNDHSLSKRHILWRFTGVDLFLALFITINTILGIYGLVAALSAFLFIFVGKLISFPRKSLVILAYVLLGVYSFALAIHIIPGFYRPLILEEVISTNQNIFQLYLSTDKALAGLLLLAYIVNVIVVPKIKWVMFSISGAVFIIILSLLLGISLDIKYGNYLLWFIPINLFVTCLAEEIFFRGIIQKGINKVFPDTFWGGLFTVLIVSYLFIAAHGMLYIDTPIALLYFCAGFLYALTYQLTQSILLSILAHFSVNILHILLLEYPLTIT
jgi:membrane protease YdiL (CAAX protease family)